METIPGRIEDGKVILEAPLPRGASGPIMVCFVSDPDRAEWLRASEESLRRIWDNEDDDVFNVLLSS